MWPCISVRRLMCILSVNSALLCVSTYTCRPNEHLRVGAQVRLSCAPRFPRIPGWGHGPPSSSHIAPSSTHEVDMGPWAQSQCMRGGAGSWSPIPAGWEQCRDPWLCAASSRPGLGSRNLVPAPTWPLFAWIRPTLPWVPNLVFRAMAQGSPQIHGEPHVSNYRSLDLSHKLGVEHPCHSM